MTSHRVGSAAVLPAACAALTLAVLAPLLGGGYVLAYDMVFTPRQPLLADSVGLGSALPRAVPVDAVVALLTTVLPGFVVQHVALAAAVFGAAWGAGRLVPARAPSTRVVAACVYGWNAYLAERLFLGHWTLLLAYASLPWVVSAGLRLRAAERPVTISAWGGLVLACAPAVLVPTGGVLAAGAALASAGRRRAPGVLAVSAVLNAPWWVPSVLRPAGSGSDPAAVAAFAARSEGPGGPLASLLGLGGVWNAQVVPASRGGFLVPLAALLLVAGALAGVRPLAARWGRGPVLALAVLAAAGLLLAAAGSLPGTGGVLRWAVVHVPGAGLLRDGQKWIAWWALLAAPCAALAVEALARRCTDPAVRAMLLAVAVALPFALLPDLAWGGLGRLSTVDYPAEWSTVRDALARDPRPGDVLVLPFATFRRFDWNGGRTLLDPAPRFLPRATVVDDTLQVGTVRVAGEDPRAARVREAVAAGAPLGPLGIGWVLVEHGTPGELDPRVLAGLSTVHSGAWLTLYRVPGAIASSPTGTPPGLPVLAADGTALALVAAALLRRWLLVGRLGKPAGLAAVWRDGDLDAEHPWPRNRSRARGHPRRQRELHAGDDEEPGREGGAGA